MHKTNILKSFKRCVSFCTADTYDIVGLGAFFKKKGYVVWTAKDVIHITKANGQGDIFFFHHGSFVAWGFQNKEEQKFIEYVKPYSSHPLNTIEIDHFYFKSGEKTTLETDNRFSIDIILLSDDDPQIKLAISYGLGQSIKLEAFEEACKEAIKKNGYLPQEIASKGVISLSRRAIFKRMGEIFLARSSINLNIEYLDVPEFFWRNPNLEPYYIITKQFLDIPNRVMALNQKLDVLQELLDILNSQVQHRHSSLLESIIILLIIVEIIVSLFQFHLM